MTTIQDLVMSGVSKRFANTMALQDLNLEVAQGELVALLGPSGCGKTTALRIIAGLEKADSGSILLRQVDITRIPAHRRHMGMVFQQYSLFPNLSAEENVAFGLRMQSVRKANRLGRARELLDLVGLSQLAKRFPHEMSGGQQQRVALARALAIEPSVLLLDEPLSALDAKVRANLREEIRRLQLELGMTAIFVTHDQEEAMAISDRVAVMSKGKIEQIATPDVLYNSPTNAFVASFVGQMNRIPAVLDGSTVSVFGISFDATKNSTTAIEVEAMVRPESLRVLRKENPTTRSFEATVVTRSFLGPVSLLTVKAPNGSLLQSMIASTESLQFHPGDAVNLEISDSKLMIG